MTCSVRGVIDWKHEDSLETVRGRELIIAVLVKTLDVMLPL